MWGDQLWLARFAAQADGNAQALGGGLLDVPPDAVHETVLHADWSALRLKRGQLDAAIEAWLAALLAQAGVDPGMTDLIALAPQLHCAT